MTRQALRLLAVLPLTALAVAGCSDDSDDSDNSNADDTISIVASTNVYGDIAQAVAGDHAEVTSYITSAAQDPHEYEASAQDRVALDEADIVIKNGGGFDPFVDTLLDGSGTDATVLDAVDISGLEPEGEPDEDGHVEGFNEHVWYDFATVEKVAEALSKELSDLDADNASTYEANYAAFKEQVDGLVAEEDSLSKTADGRGVAITEPVPLYLLSAVGLENRTPEEFSEAVEEGADVPARVLQETLDLFSGEDVAVLAYNAQTENGTTEQVRAAADSAGVPVVDFTETLPDGDTYVEWQQANLDNLTAALG